MVQSNTNNFKQICSTLKSTITPGRVDLGMRPLKGYSKDLKPNYQMQFKCYRKVKVGSYKNIKNEFASLFRLMRSSNIINALHQMVFNHIFNII